MIKAEPKRNKTFLEAVEDNIGKPLGVFPPAVNTPNTYSLPEEIEKVKNETLKKDVTSYREKSKEKTDQGSSWNTHLKISFNR